jgi:hypothetical protein
MDNGEEKQGEFVESWIYRDGEWVREDEWWTKARLQHFAEQVASEQETFRWILRRRALRRVRNASVLALAGLAAVATLRILRRHSVQKA